MCFRVSQSGCVPVGVPSGDTSLNEISSQEKVGNDDGGTTCNYVAGLNLAEPSSRHLIIGLTGGKKFRGLTSTRDRTGWGTQESGDSPIQSFQSHG